MIYHLGPANTSLLAFLAAKDSKNWFFMSKGLHSTQPQCRSNSTCVLQILLTQKHTTRRNELMSCKWHTHTHFILVTAGYNTTTTTVKTWIASAIDRANLYGRVFPFFSIGEIYSVTGKLWFAMGSVFGRAPQQRRSHFYLNSHDHIWDCCAYVFSLYKCGMALRTSRYGKNSNI